MASILFNEIKRNLSLKNLFEDREGNLYDIVGKLIEEGEVVGGLVETGIPGFGSKRARRLTIVRAHLLLARGRVA